MNQGQKNKTHTAFQVSGAKEATLLWSFSLGTLTLEVGGKSVCVSVCVSVVTSSFLKDLYEKRFKELKRIRHY